MTLEEKYSSGVCANCGKKKEEHPFLINLLHYPKALRYCDATGRVWQDSGLKSIYDKALETRAELDEATKAIHEAEQVITQLTPHETDFAAFSCLQRLREFLQKNP